VICERASKLCPRHRLLADLLKETSPAHAVERNKALIGIGKTVRRRR